MISRLTALAACFAVLSAATIIAFAASGVAQPEVHSTAATAAPHHVQLPQVQIVGHRSHDTGR